MTPDIEKWLAEDSVTFTPVAGLFDVEAIAAAISGMGYSFRDEADPSRFVITSDERGRDVFQARRRADPASKFPYVPLVTVTPEQVTLMPIANHRDLRALSAQFLEWLTSNYACRAQEEAADEPDWDEP